MTAATREDKTTAEDAEAVLGEIKAKYSELFLRLKGGLYGEKAKEALRKGLVEIRRDIGARLERLLGGHLSGNGQRNG